MKHPYETIKFVLFRPQPAEFKKTRFKHLLCKCGETMFEAINK